MEITKAYFAKQADEITLQQADVVLVLQEEDGECGRATPEWVSTRLGCSPDKGAVTSHAHSACLILVSTSSKVGTGEMAQLA